MTIGDIHARNGHSKVAIYAAVKRLNIQHLTFKRVRLYSPWQADYLKEHMRSSDNRSGKAATSTPRF